ncbi:MAG: hypothetical protein HONDAALG_02547 [Gammaproteobacteria bacterium]|nr:hypothetical protein [Gammaproteobacteria bacterium]
MLKRLVILTKPPAQGIQRLLQSQLTSRIPLRLALRIPLTTRRMLECHSNLTIQSPVHIPDSVDDRLKILQVLYDLMFFFVEAVKIAADPLTSLLRNPIPLQIRPNLLKSSDRLLRLTVRPFNIMLLALVERLEFTYLTISSLNRHKPTLPEMPQRFMPQPPSPYTGRRPGCQPDHYHQRQSLSKQLREPRKNLTHNRKTQEDDQRGRGDLAKPQRTPGLKNHEG